MNFTPALRLLKFTQYVVVHVQSLYVWTFRTKTVSFPKCVCLCDLWCFSFSLSGLAKLQECAATVVFHTPTQKTDIYYFFLSDVYSKQSKTSSLIAQGLLMGYFHIQCIHISAAAALHYKSHTCLFSLKNVSLLTFLCIFEEDN